MEQTCCFTGHREIPPEERTRLYSALLATVEQLHGEGFNTFITGGARGFDTLAALAVLEVKKRFPGLTLTLALPCENHFRSWSREDIALFEQSKQGASRIHILRHDYRPGCMQERNRFMVDHSSVCVAYLVKNEGGTYYTVRYARKQGKRVLIYQGGFDREA